MITVQYRRDYPGGSTFILKDKCISTGKLKEIERVSGASHITVEVHFSGKCLEIFVPKVNEFSGCPPGADIEMGY